MQNNIELKDLNGDDVEPVTREQFEQLVMEAADEAITKYAETFKLLRDFDYKGDKSKNN